MVMCSFTQSLNMENKTSLANRYEHNPILVPSSIPPSYEGMQIECLLNPGAFAYQGKIGLLLRVAERPPQQEGHTTFPIIGANGQLQILDFDNNDPDLDLSDKRIVKYRGVTYLSTISHLRLVWSDDGINFKEPSPPVRLIGSGELETFGIEDCRVAQMGDEYHLTYTQVSENGVGVGLITTRNWKDFERRGMIMPPHNKDCALFEEKINGLYYCMHRPSGVDLGGNFIWIASSPDLINWGNHRCAARTRLGHWDSGRVGAGCSPIKTERGWLSIYHGATKANRYCLGALLFDLHDPYKVIGRSDEPLMQPETVFETKGFFGEVIFTNGHIVNGDVLTVYYGAADEVICMATFSIKEILATLA
jgi:predicted GH43/DUF377 family glycosyl hydrolase